MVEDQELEQGAAFPAPDALGAHRPPVEQETKLTGEADPRPAPSQVPCRERIRPGTPCPMSEVALPNDGTPSRCGKGPQGS